MTRRKLLAASALAGAGATAPVGVLLGLAHAHQATPSATPVVDEAAFFVQFVHFEKYFASFGVTLDAEQLASLYGLDAATYGQIGNEFDATARRAAEELLAEPGFADRVAGLPFAPGDTVVGIGDSITDDLQSWLEILRHLLELQRPGDGIQVFNEGISGDTMTDVLLRFISIILEQPAWILCLAGTNDAVRYGRQPTKTLVSLNETTRNLAELRHLAATEAAARWAWITPLDCDEDRIAADPLSAQFEMSLVNDDVYAVAEVVRQRPEPAVDLFDLFGQPPDPELLMEDGIHPTDLGRSSGNRPGAG